MAATARWIDVAVVPLTGPIVVIDNSIQTQLVSTDTLRWVAGQIYDYFHTKPIEKNWKLTSSTPGFVLNPHDHMYIDTKNVTSVLVHLGRLNRDTNGIIFTVAHSGPQGAACAMQYTFASNPTPFVHDPPTLTYKDHHRRLCSVLDYVADSQHKMDHRIYGEQTRRGHCGVAVTAAHRGGECGAGSGEKIQIRVAATDVIK
jgi:hypothetical protein